MRKNKSEALIKETLTNTKSQVKFMENSLFQQGTRKNNQVREKNRQKPTEFNRIRVRYRKRRERFRLHSLRRQSSIAEKGIGRGNYTEKKDRENIFEKSEYKSTSLSLKAKIRHNNTSIKPECLYAVEKI